MLLKLGLILIFAICVQCISREKVVERAKCWVNKRVPYSQSRYSADCDTGKSYRTDCSGYVSLVWELSSSYTTRTLPNVCRRIEKSELRKGDILLAPGYHVILFDRWVDNNRKKYWAYEQTPPRATHHIQTYNSRYYPCRYQGITG